MLTFIFCQKKKKLTFIYGDTRLLIVNQLGNQETNYDNNNMKTNPRGNLRLENDYKR
jgi:hypothetical protein